MISSSSQAPKCVIKAKDPCLHQISVAASGFLIIGPIPKDDLIIDPISEGIPKVALPFQRAAEKEVTPSQPAIKEEEEIVEISKSEENFEVFSYLQSLKVLVKGFSYSSSAQVS